MSEGEYPSRLGYFKNFNLSSEVIRNARVNVPQDPGRLSLSVGAFVTGEPFLSSEGLPLPKTLLSYIVVSSLNRRVVSDLAASFISNNGINLLAGLREVITTVSLDLEKGATLPGTQNAESHGLFSLTNRGIVMAIGEARPETPNVIVDYYRNHPAVQRDIILMAYTAPDFEEPANLRKAMDQIAEGTFNPTTVKINQGFIQIVQDLW